MNPKLTAVVEIIRMRKAARLAGKRVQRQGTAPAPKPEKAATEQPVAETSPEPVNESMAEPEPEQIPEPASEPEQPAKVSKYKKYRKKKAEEPAVTEETVAP